MNDYNGMNVNINKNLSIWIDELKLKNVNTIIYSLSDINYKTRFDEMITTFNVPNTCFTMCAFDKETYNYFLNKNIPTILLDKEDNQFNHLVCISKFLLTYVLLKNGFNVIMSEADIFWKVDVNKLFENYMDSSDLIISKHTYNTEVNIGFYKVISNTNTINFFENLNSWIFDKNSGYKEMVFEKVFLKKLPHRAADQKIFDCALRHCNDERLSTAQYYFSQESYNLLQRITLNWKYIECDVLMHWPIRYPNNYKGVHIWSGFSKIPKEQITHAHDHKWYYNK